MPYDQGILILSILSKEMSSHAYQETHKRMFMASLWVNSANVETTQTSTIEWLYLVHSYNGI